MFMLQEKNAVFNTCVISIFNSLVPTFCIFRYKPKEIILRKPAKMCLLQVCKKALEFYLYLKCLHYPTLNWKKLPVK